MFVSASFLAIHQISWGTIPSKCWKNRSGWDFHENTDKQTRPLTYSSIVIYSSFPTILKIILFLLCSIILLYVQYARITCRSHHLYARCFLSRYVVLHHLLSLSSFVLSSFSLIRSSHPSCYLRSHSFAPLILRVIFVLTHSLLSHQTNLSLWYSWSSSKRNLLDASQPVISMITTLLVNSSMRYPKTNNTWITVFGWNEFN